MTISGARHVHDGAVIRRAAALRAAELRATRAA